LKRSVLSIISGSHPAATGSALLRHPWLCIAFKSVT
jgi:hypothetical protein